uniref:hypothetical protein n=1 Tax=Enterobacter cloacae TaxID=550 RepID=UPI001953B79D
LILKPGGEAEAARALARFSGAGSLAVAVLALAACSDKPAFKNLDITGSKSFGTDFSLTDHTGKRRTLE